MQAQLAAKDLACRRGDRVLFSGLDFTLEPREALHVVGANGVGKSSLLRILAGLRQPFAGTATHSGTIGLVDERDALEPELPLGRALAFWHQLDGTIGNTADHEMLGLSSLLDIPVRYLSTGQRKRAALARLTAQDAAIWLLDEPLNGLDREGKALLETMIAKHCADGGICLLASHQPIALPGNPTLVLEDYAQ